MSLLSLGINRLFSTWFLILSLDLTCENKYVGGTSECCLNSTPMNLNVGLPCFNSVQFDG